MQLFTNWKKQVFPSICIILYVIFLWVDIYTTYLASPDLKLEANPIIRYFQWGWTELLFWNFFMSSIAILFAILSNKYIFNFFKNKKQNKLTGKFLFCLSFLLLVHAYYCFIVSIHAPINNYLSYLYLFPNQENIFQKIAISYVEFYIKFNNRFGAFTFVYIKDILSYLLGILIVFFQINRVKKYV